MSYAEQGLRYGAVLSALVAANGVGTRAATAFENRLKHLKRNGFPEGANLGKTGRYHYTAADIVGIATAIRLIDAYVMPTTAIQLVRSGAAEIAMLALDVIVPPLVPRAGPQLDLDGSATAHDTEQPDPFLARDYALFAGAALSELGERAPGAGRYDAPVGRATLLARADLGGELSLAIGSGILVGGQSTYGRLIDELEKRALGRRQLAAGLLATLAPEAAAGAATDVHNASPTLRPGLWHLSMLLRLLDGWEAAQGPDEHTRMVAHHARLLLHPGNGGGPGDAAALAIGGASGTTVTELVLHLLDLSGFPEIGLPTGWPVSRVIELAEEARLPVGDHLTLRRRFLAQVPLLASPTTIRMS